MKNAELIFFSTGRDIFLPDTIISDAFEHFIHKHRFASFQYHRAITLTNFLIGYFRRTSRGYTHYN
jgi:hypothetical protein